MQPVRISIEAEEESPVLYKSLGAKGKRQRQNITPIIINNKEEISPEPGSFYRLKRLWKDGDEVTLELPMDIRVSSGYKGLISIYRGRFLWP